MNLRSHVKITQFIPLTPHVLEWTGSSQTAVREEREGRESASLVYEEIFALRRSRVSSKEGVGRKPDALRFIRARRPTGAGLH